MAAQRVLYQIDDPNRPKGVIVVEEAFNQDRLEVYYTPEDAELILADLHPEITVTKVVLTLH